MELDEIKKKIIVALDFDSADQALSLAENLVDQVGYVKVGKQLFTQNGPSIVFELKKMNYKIFLDLKFHDIPNTVEKACYEVARMGVDMFNVHASGGIEMMKSAVKGTLDAKHDLNLESKPVLLAVTVLTSLTDNIVQNEIGFKRTASEQVVHFSKLAFDSGIDGVVASPREVSAIQAKCGLDFITVTPGVRPVWAAKGDQKRVLTPGKAIEQGVNYLVIGRPITASKSPKEAAKKIVKEIQEGLG